MPSALYHNIHKPGEINANIALSITAIIVNGVLIAASISFAVVKNKHRNTRLTLRV